MRLQKQAVLWKLKNLDTNETAEFVTDADGVASIKADKAGNYQLTVTKTPYKYFVAPLAQFEAKEHVSIKEK